MTTRGQRRTKIARLAVTSTSREVKSTIVAACYPADASVSSEKRLSAQNCRGSAGGRETVISASVQLWAKLIVAWHGVVSRPRADGKVYGACPENLVPPGPPGFCLL